MKIAIISDLHFGFRGVNRCFLNQQNIFLDRFFKYLLDNNINVVFDMGDILDKKKTIDYYIFSHIKDNFVERLKKYNIEYHLIVGNHDMSYRDLVSTELLFHNCSNIIVYRKPKEIEIDGTSFLMIPWIYKDNFEECINFIKKSKSDTICGHFEMKGVPWQRNNISITGLNKSLFSSYLYVFSGHFHCPSDMYVGSPYQMTWGDYGDKKRIIIFDTKKQTTEDVFLSDDVFIKYDYSGNEDLNTYDFSIFKEKNVKINVISNEDPYHYENFIENVSAFNPNTVDVKESYLYIKSDTDILETDTANIICDSVDEQNEIGNDDKKTIKKIMMELYKEATNNDY